ncbi:hypothetical protein GF342_01205 [Candidatus Woesearchaeota archaeon]|nr:hypothetical protein [Candidatus Woesearchaeota archaeon]
MFILQMKECEKHTCLKTGKHEQKQLLEFIDRALDDLKRDPACGIKIPKKLIPKDYIKQYEVTNLWKYDLPNAWRLIYSIQEDKINIISIVIEWFDHKDYEKRFKY